MTATPVTKKKAGTDTFVEPSQKEDTTDILSPADVKPKKTSALVKGQLQSEAVFSLHAALQAEYLQTEGEQAEEEATDTKTSKMEGHFIKGYHTATPLKIVQNTVGQGDIMIEMYVREYKGEAIKGQ